MKLRSRWLREAKRGDCLITDSHHRAVTSRATYCKVRVSTKKYLLVDPDNIEPTLYVVKVIKL